MLRAGTSAPPTAAAFSRSRLGLYAANYRLRRGNDEFKIERFPVILAVAQALQAVMTNRQASWRLVCVGGAILSYAAAVMVARGQHQLVTVTLLTTMLDFSDTGEIGLPIHAGSALLRDSDDREGRHSARQGTGVHVRNTLRANDLIWR